jgi:hypothetical protein
MDMWRSSIDVPARWVPKARVCVDCVHVARQVGDAVITVLEPVHARLSADGVRTLVGTKYMLLANPAAMRPE